MGNNAKTCHVLINENNKKVTDTKQILKMQHKFYQDLYSEDKTVRFSMINHTNKKLTQRQRLDLKKQLTVDELSNALAQMPPGKTPGGNGITVSCMKVFWRYLKEPLHKALVQGIVEGRLYPSARRGIISLIPKPNKDSRKLKNLRPISLLNVDFKIFEKALANRISTVIDNLISYKQQGFMKNRRIAANIRMVLDLIQKSNDEDMENVIVSLDFMKCFDRISHKTMFSTLRFFGFGEYFTYIYMVIACYKDCMLVIQNKGYFSETISIQRGVRQGSPNSSFLFLLCAELLAIKLDESEKLEDIPVGEMIHLFRKYADDIDTYLREKGNCFEELFKIIEEFSMQTGFKINYEKPVYRIGSLKDACAQCYTQRKLIWSDKPINILGITVSNDLQETVKINYTETIKKAEAILTSWKNRKLSLIGKIMVYNTLVVSLFVYPMTVLPSMTTEMYKKMDNLCKDFLWDQKKSKIALDILQLPQENGGCGLANLKAKDTALKASWIHIINSDKGVANLAYRYIDPIIKEDIWKCNLKLTDIPYMMKTKNIFWEQMLCAWCKTNYKLTEESVSDQLLWWNSNIRKQGRPFCNIKAWEKGLKTVGQLFNSEGNLNVERMARQFSLILMDVNSIISALPKEWKKYDETLKIMPTTVIRSCKQVYKILTQDENRLTQKCANWEKELGKPIGINDYITAFSWSKKLMVITKYQSFQCRLLQ